MKNEVLIKMASARKKLEENLDSILFAKISEPYGGIMKEADLPVYHEFLGICDGARFLDVDFFGFRDVQRSRLLTPDINGGEALWLYVGQILYEPLLINRQDLKLYFFSRSEQGYSEFPIKCFGGLDEFLLCYIFGEQYRDISINIENDEWYDFLQQNNYFAVPDI